MIGLRPCTDYTAYIETYENDISIPFCKIYVQLNLFVLSYLKLHIMYKIC